MPTRKKRPPKDPNRVKLSTCVGKLTAYVRLDKEEEAKHWAKELVLHLKTMGLLE